MNTRGMRAGALLCGMLAGAPISAIEIEGNHIILSDEEMLLCQLDGGCVVVTGNALKEEIQSRVDRALVACKSRI